MLDTTNIDQTKYIIVDRQELGNNIRKTLAPLKEKGLLGRPFKLTEAMVIDILDMIQQGISYSIIAKKHNISKTIVSRIKQKGIALVDRISQKNKLKKENLEDQHLLFLKQYAEKLQKNLKTKYNIYLNFSDCYNTLKTIFNDKDNDTKHEYDYFEYSPSSGEYIELTSHTLYRKHKGFK